MLADVKKFDKTKYVVVKQQDRIEYQNDTNVTRSCYKLLAFYHGHEHANTRDNSLNQVKTNSSNAWTLVA